MSISGGAVSWVFDKMSSLELVNGYKVEDKVLRSVAVDNGVTCIKEEPILARKARPIPRYHSYFQIRKSIASAVGYLGISNIPCSNKVS